MTRAARNWHPISELKWYPLVIADMPRATVFMGVPTLYVRLLAEPTLTAVSYDMHAMGRIAATRLYQLLEGADPYPWSVLVPTSLVIRESA